MLLLLLHRKLRLHLSPQCYKLLLLSPHLLLLLLKPHLLLLLHRLVVALPPFTGVCILRHPLVSVHAWFKLPAIAMQEIAGNVCIVDACDKHQLVNHVPQRKKVVVRSLVVVRQKYPSSVASKDPGRGRRLLLSWHFECLEGLRRPLLCTILADGGVHVFPRTEQVLLDAVPEKKMTKMV
jgi:hypothetical protein